MAAVENVIVQGLFYVWLIQILDGGWNEGFKDSLGYTGIRGKISRQNVTHKYTLEGFAGHGGRLTTLAHHGCEGTHHVTFNECL